MTDNWFESPLGTQLLRAERQVTGELLNRVFGYYLVQYGHWGSRDGFLSQTRIQRRILAAPPGTRILRPMNRPDIWAAPQRLPFASDSIDALVLPHTLEFTAAPHEVLRESGRILIGDGRLLILGFNPWGLCGLRRKLDWRSQFPWNGRFISERRLSDWLQLLGMDILTTRRYFFRLPVGHAGLLERSRWLDRWSVNMPFMACGYAVLAGKRLFGANPLQRRTVSHKSRRVGAATGSVTHQTHV